MDTFCLAAQLTAHLVIFITIMARYNRLVTLQNRTLSLIAALIAGVSLAASIRIILTWPEPISFIDYLESFLVVLVAIHVARCGGHMSRILWVNTLKSQS